jgi:2-polyprenyl-3-methyl-5-hydroxy-6-metoxy-1,4-benzoquinol methylase
MQTDNITRNIEHYDTVYSQVTMNDIVKKVRNLESFLDDATKTDTSWHGFYQGDFANRLKGKKVLELGCGDGLNALIMAALGADVIANDISTESERLIHESATALQLNNIQAVSGNFVDLPFEKHSFDFVVGKAFLHHLTHETESIYLNKVATLLKPNGEARFFEPATNNQTLDTLRWMIPVPGRPSILNRNAFANYKKQDPHPERDNSSEHFVQVGRQFFVDIKIICIGSIERFCRLLPQGQLNRSFRRWAHRIETKLPKWFRYQVARSQLIVYTQPRITSGLTPRAVDSGDSPR